MKGKTSLSYSEFDPLQAAEKKASSNNASILKLHKLVTLRSLVYYSCIEFKKTMEGIRSNNRHKVKIQSIDKM